MSTFWKCVRAWLKRELASILAETDTKETALAIEAVTGAATTAVAEAPAVVTTEVVGNTETITDPQPAASEPTVADHVAAVEAAQAALTTARATKAAAVAQLDTATAAEAEAVGILSGAIAAAETSAKAALDAARAMIQTQSGAA